MAEGVMDPIFLAWSRLRRRRLDDVVDICTNVLSHTPLDQQAWYLKARALIEKAYVDDNELEDEGVAEVLMDDNAVAALPRPGTSLVKPLGQSQGVGGAGNRPMSLAGRPLTGFARPGTQSSKAGGVNEALGGFRPMTSRPVTSSGGRFVRPLTSSFASDVGGRFINLERLNLVKYAGIPPLAKILCDYMLYVEPDPKRVLELAALATEKAHFKDWWWKSRLGKCYFKLGLIREAERQWRSSLEDQGMVSTYLSLAKVFLKLDQPNAALEVFLRGAEKHPGEISLILGVARVYDAVNDIPRSMQFYKKALHFDNSCVEAIACIAANHFYTDQPEVALRYYRRLLQMGVNTVELWNNLGLCCFYAQQYDMTLTCFQWALDLATDENMADVWYNISHVVLGIGDLNLAYQALKVATNVDPTHAEAFNNLGVLEMRRGRRDEGRSCFQTSAEFNIHMHEPVFNAALLAKNNGNLEEASRLVTKALQNAPDHAESKELRQQLQELVGAQ